MLRCKGEVVRFTKKSWSMEGRSGITKTVRVQTTRADFVDVVISEDIGEPRDGDFVDYAVVPGISGGKVRLSVASEWSAVAATVPEQSSSGDRPRRALGVPQAS